MKINLDEKQTVLNIIKDGIIDKKPSDTIKLLAKYHHKNGMNTEQIYDEIDNFMKKNYKEYNSVLWCSLIEGIIKRVIKENWELNYIKSINITQSEIEFIKRIKGEKFQKLTFTYLVYAKILNSINDNNNNWVAAKYRNEIFKDANITETGKQQLLILNKMINDSIFTMAKNITNNSINVSNYINETDEVIWIVDDFRELGLQYLQFIGNDKIINCEDCKRVIIYSSNCKKYCKECARKIKLENDRVIQKERYNSRK